MPLLTNKDFAMLVESKEKVNYENMDGLDLGQCYDQLNEFDKKPQDYQRVLQNLTFLQERDCVGATTALAVLNDIKTAYDKTQGAQSTFFKKENKSDDSHPSPPGGPSLGSSK